MKRPWPVTRWPYEYSSSSCCRPGVSATPPPLWWDKTLGRSKPERAVQSVWTTAGYNVIFMLSVSIFFFLFGEPVINFMNSDPEARHYALQALRIISPGYVFWGIEMVMMNAFNGAGDTRTPTIVNLICFWLFQIPVAWVLSQYYIKEPKGIFYYYRCFAACCSFGKCVPV